MRLAQNPTSPPDTGIDLGQHSPKAGKGLQPFFAIPTEMSSQRWVEYALTWSCTYGKRLELASLNCQSHSHAIDDKLFHLQCKSSESELGQTRRFGGVRATSALPSKTDIHRDGRHVSKVPLPDIHRANA
jgi:hypothetical protein